MCRAGGRKCPSHTDPTAIAERNERRRKQYRKNKQNHIKEQNNGVQTNPIITGSLTSEQSQYFQNSKAAVDGQLIPLYHGSHTDFTSFNPELLGKGNDSWGNGFYFTNQKSVAEGYANETKSENANVKEFYLNLTNPMYVDGKEKMSLIDITFTSDVASRILKQHPQAYVQPNDEEGEMSFLGDYSERYWDKDEYTKEELDTMIDEVAEQHFSNVSWVELEMLYGKDNGSAFLHAIHEETGHDGVIVDFGADESKHYIAWFPNQMKLTSNTSPEDNTAF